MANWKHYINNDYSGCMLLAYAHDQHRNRDVRIYLIPGVEDCVGVTDGVDAWIAPVSASLFSVNVERLLNDLREGKGIPKPTPIVRSPRVKLIREEPAKPSRVRLLPTNDQQPRSSRRVLLA